MIEMIGYAQEKLLLECRSLSLWVAQTDGKMIFNSVVVMKKILLCTFLFMAAFSSVLFAKGQLVTESRADIFRDGSKERVQLILVQGKKYHDRELWCGSGWKYEGVFSISVLFSDGRRVETTLNSFWDNEPLFFYSRPWTIKFADYNHDGVLDINLGQYAGSNTPFGPRQLI